MLYRSQGDCDCGNTGCENFIREGELILLACGNLPVCSQECAGAAEKHAADEAKRIKRNAKSRERNAAVRDAYASVGMNTKGRIYGRR